MFSYISQCPAGAMAYAIRAGDTLGRIAQQYNTTVQAIMNINPGIDPNRLFIGQQICIPRPQISPGVCPAGTISYAIKAGDTLSKIAQQYNTTVQAILIANPGIDPYRLFIDQQICVPENLPATCPAGSIPYAIKTGDTLARIAQQHNTTVQAILNINPSIDPNRLQIGQRVCVPRNEPPVYAGCPQANFYVVVAGDTLGKIAQYFNVSVSEIQRLNPSINPNSLIIGQAICIPIVPSPVRIEVNKSAFRLTLYRNGRVVKTYPIAIGKPSTPTPEGTFTVINKQVNPGGPFGTRWLGLSKPSYGIHGNSNPSSIGTMASNGCVRLYNNDVNELFNFVPVGTEVRIF
ncbi:MAG: LysM peptidoglycan-binding domain-containing protein [Clostridia bacterium]